MASAVESGVTRRAGAPAAVIADDRPYVDWHGIFAGVAIAAAISLIFLSFGSAVGLSLTLPFEGAGASATALVIATALYFVWVQVSGFIAGGYFAGRLRRRIGDATRHEANMRDGAHGLAVWAVGVILSALLAVAAVSGALNLGVSALGAAGSQAADWSYDVDRLLRSAPAAAGATPAPAAEPADQSARDELGRILARNVVRGEINADDRTYAASAIARAAGISEADAATRIDAAVTEARQAAETARKGGILLAFLTTASLLISALAAWWAATMGGDHRDEGTDYSAVVRWW